MVLSDGVGCFVDFTGVLGMMSCVVSIRRWCWILGVGIGVGIVVGFVF